MREVMDEFENGKFDLLTLTETKMKECGEDERLRRVAVFMSELWQKSM